MFKPVLMLNSEDMKRASVTVKDIVAKITGKGIDETEKILQDLGIEYRISSVKPEITAEEKERYFNLPPIEQCETYDRLFDERQWSPRR